MRKEEQPLADSGHGPGLVPPRREPWPCALASAQQTRCSSSPLPSTAGTGRVQVVSLGAGRTCSWASFCSSLGEARSFTRGQRQM